MKRMIQLTVACVVVLVATAGQVRAEIIGSTNLLDAGKLSQLEGWLGEGPLDIHHDFPKH